MTTRIHQSCKHCGQGTGRLTLYRDPFAEASAPGRWPALTMHPHCFLAYISERRSLRLSNA